MKSVAEFPRELTQEERDVLDFQIEANDDTERLRRLFADSKVTGECRCGCGSLELTIDSTAAMDDWPENVWRDDGYRNPPLPGKAYATVGGLRDSLLVLLHVARNDAQLEFVWGDPSQKQCTLPPVTEFRAERRDTAGDGQLSR
jgi:hypothetical protein